MDFVYQKNAEKFVFLRLDGHVKNGKLLKMSKKLKFTMIVTVSHVELVFSRGSDLTTTNVCPSVSQSTNFQNIVKSIIP